MPRIAIAGNPNAGKTSLFNLLTGSTQQVSNYPGVTVECKEGRLRYKDRTAQVVDLPGTYSLTAYSQEERVARDFIIDEKPAVVLDVVDASNLERNLYLATQIMEMRVPMVISLNMIDLAEKKGIEIDAPKLSRLLGVPVVPTVGNRGRGLEQLRDTCFEVADHPENFYTAEVSYGHEVEQEIVRLTHFISSVPQVSARYHPRWLAVKLIEGDEEMTKRVRELAEERYREIYEATQYAIRSIESHFRDDVATIIAERRYGFAAGACKECVLWSAQARQDATDRIDSVVCHRFFGPFILFGVVAALFYFIFKVSDEWAWVPWFGGQLSPTGVMEWLFEQLSGWLSLIEGSMPMLHSLLTDGIIGGVGGVMGFVPLIFFMFLFISVLEDTGYVARVAFILDRVLQMFGLQGKSILAMIVSGGLGAGGCAVPGVLATRTLREEKDRIITILVTPFMNCGAKMPVYAMLIAAFFKERRTEVMLILWIISWALALCSAWILRKTLFRGEKTPFVMELPAYHVPTLRGVIRHTWERTWMYIKKAGTIILGISIILWVFMYFPRLPEDAANDQSGRLEQLAHSYAGRLGVALEPVSQLAGFEWRTNIALIGGFVAKEVVVGTLGTLYAFEEVEGEDHIGLSKRLSRDPDWSPLRAFALMIFVMAYAPCLATIAVIRKETGSWKWALFSTAYSTTLAFLLAMTIYQVGKFFI
jgi:ferrous iron transport protein B